MYDDSEVDGDENNNNSEHSERNNHFTIDEEDDDDSYTGPEVVKTTTLETGVLTRNRLNRRSIISRLKDDADNNDILPCRSLMLKSQRGLYFYDDDSNTAETESLEDYFEDEDNKPLQGKIS